MLGGGVVQDVARVGCRRCARMLCACICDVNVDVEQMVRGGNFNIRGKGIRVGHEAEVVSD